MFLVFASLAGCWQNVPTYLSIAARPCQPGWLLANRAYVSIYCCPPICLFKCLQYPYLSICLSVCLSVYLQNHLLYIIIKKNKQALAGDWWLDLSTTSWRRQHVNIYIYIYRYVVSKTGSSPKTEPPT